MVHLIRASMRFVSYADPNERVAAALKPIYTAIDNHPGADGPGPRSPSSILGRTYPAAVKTWEDASVPVHTIAQASGPPPAK